jgi:hypothetical protein
MTKVWETRFMWTKTANGKSLITIRSSIALRVREQTKISKLSAQGQVLDSASKKLKSSASWWVETCPR